MLIEILSNIFVYCPDLPTGASLGRWSNIWIEGWNHYTRPIYKNLVMQTVKSYERTRLFADIFIVSLKSWPTVRKQPHATNQPEYIDHLLTYLCSFRAIL